MEYTGMHILECMYWNACTGMHQAASRQILCKNGMNCRSQFWAKQGWTTTFAVSSAGTSIVFDMSLTYILVALVAVILNNALVEMLSLHTRIAVGKFSGGREDCASLLAVHFFASICHKKCSSSGRR